jgi:hypothetical protein
MTTVPADRCEQRAPAIFNSDADLEESAHALLTEILAISVVVVCNAPWWRRHCIGISYEWCARQSAWRTTDNYGANAVCHAGDGSNIALCNFYVCHTPPTRRSTYDGCCSGQRSSPWLSCRNSSSRQWRTSLSVTKVVFHVVAVPALSRSAMILVTVASGDTLCSGS